jgi:hypothetical protein
VSELVPQTDRSRSITNYNPAKGLAKIAKAEAGEKHFRRAKDRQKLVNAINEKLQAQADYVCWRDACMAVAIADGGPGRGKKGVPASRPLLPEGDPGKKIIHKWRKRLCMKNGKGTEIDPKKIKDALDEAGRQCTRICEQQPMGTIRGTEGTGEYERYTPPQYIEAVRKVLGKIDLDPASCAKAQATVKAVKYFSEKDDGLTHEWHGNVFLNPPYHRELMPKFIDKLVQEFEAGHVKQAILLTNNGTDTDWFDTAFRICASICFTHGRIHFTQPNGTEVLMTQGQAFLYFGRNVQRFENVFRTIGLCMRPSAMFSKEA